MGTISFYMLLAIINFLFGMLGGVGVCELLDSLKSETNEKPIIRHCKNCEYCGERFACDYCTVKYQGIDLGRPKALFCRFYKKKEGGRDD